MSPSAVPGEAVEGVAGEACAKACSSSMKQRRSEFSGRCSMPKPRWRKKAGATASSTSFPSAEQLLDDSAFQDFIPLLPAPLIPVPRIPAGCGHRVRLRKKLFRERVIQANQVLRSLNRLDKGFRFSKMRTPPQHEGASEASRQHWNEAVAKLHERVLKLTSLDVSARADESFGDCLGAHLVEKVVKAGRTDRYTFKKDSHAQVPLIADLVVEPKIGWPSVDMLEALPERERNYYSHEENVLDCTGGKCMAVFNDIQEKYAFVGGTYNDYVKYYLRNDYDPDIWHFSDGSDVKAVAGVSCVAKKDGQLRKILMQCATNYWWDCVDERADLGMGGGSALASMYCPGGKAYFASFDESNAFTAVRTPRWFWSWASAPPVKAKDIWTKLSASLKKRLSGDDFVWPQYTRLAMGSSHAVFILMLINLQVVGQCLHNYCKFGHPGVEPKRPPEEDTRSLLSTDVSDGESWSGSIDSEEFLDSAARQVVRMQWKDGETSNDFDDDELWAKAHGPKRSAALTMTEVRPKTVKDFERHLREARAGPSRVYTVVHCFSGANRAGDFEDKMRKRMHDLNLPLLIISVDLDADAKWDLSNAATFALFMGWIKEGLIDALLGGPPCATWSILRFRPGGPRPLRLRSCPWGRPGLSAAEKARVREANVLMINYLALCEALALIGGMFIMEHPEYPGSEPFPSVFATMELGLWSCAWTHSADISINACLEDPRESLPQCRPRSRLCGAKVPSATAPTSTRRPLARFRTASS